MLVVSGVILAGAFFTDGVWAQAPLLPSSERVTVTPGEGNGQTPFRFTASGYAPGRTVAVRLTAPDGSERRFLADDGVEVVWVVGPDGGFSLEFAPVQRFPGTAPGRWRVLFCSTGAPTCQLLDFDVIP